MYTEWDPTSRMPIPQLEAVFQTEAAYWATIIFSALALLVFIYGVMNIGNRKGRIILLLMVGGALTTYVEPFLDVIGGAWHPEIGQVTAFENFGRAIPLWVFPTYIFYFGALGSLNYLSFEKGVTRRLVWLWFAVPFAVDIFMEEIMLAFDLYYYYGNQSLIVISEFPMWWAACNTMGEFLGVSALLLMMPYLKGWRMLTIPFIFPVADAVGYGVVGLPSFIAANTQDTPYWLVQLSGIATLALAALVVHAISLIIASDSPWRQGDKVVLNLK